jgi:hypothetical protein
MAMLMSGIGVPAARHTRYGMWSDDLTHVVSAQTGRVIYEARDEARWTEETRPVAWPLNVPKFGSP